jgi:uncharacterized protein YjiS (DUF1127 family)
MEIARWASEPMHFRHDSRAFRALVIGGWSAYLAIRTFDHPHHTSPTRFHTGDKTMNILKSLNNWRKRSASRSQLSRLDDRLLADIGINRSDIDAVVRKLV